MTKSGIALGLTYAGAAAYVAFLICWGRYSLPVTAAMAIIFMILLVSINNIVANYLDRWPKIDISSIGDFLAAWVIDAF